MEMLFEYLIKKWLELVENIKKHIAVWFLDLEIASYIPNKFPWCFYTSWIKAPSNLSNEE